MATASVQKLSEQMLQNPLDFVLAKQPEAVAVKPSSYVLIKPENEPKEKAGDGDGANEAKEPKEQVGKGSDAVEKPEWEFYDINELSTDSGSRKGSKVSKSWKGISQAPIGLINRGVTCYMNSAIQALVHLPAMAHYLLDIQKGKYKSTISRNSVSQEFSNLYVRLTDKASRKKAVYPSRIVARLEDINCMMSEWNQEDAHEYFMSFISRLQEDSVPKGQKLNSSILHDMFGGQLIQRVKCGSCGHESVTHQDFYDLPVTFSSKEMKKTGSYTLKRAIKDFFSPERIRSDENSGYTCEKCKQRSNAIKQSRIEHAPEYLTVHMKRFKYSGRSGQKVKEAMTYPVQFDIDEYTVNEDRPVRYKLMAVIVHEGRSLSSGHYIAYCRQPNGETWAEYDDEMIRKVSEKTVLSQESAYMLVYSRLAVKKKVVKEVVKPAKVERSPEEPQQKRRRSSDADDTIDRIFGVHEKRTKTN